MGVKNSRERYVGFARPQAQAGQSPQRRARDWRLWVFRLQLCMYVCIQPSAGRLAGQDPAGG